MGDDLYRDQMDCCTPTTNTGVGAPIEVVDGLVDCGVHRHVGFDNLTLHREICTEQQPWTLYVTCCGDPVLAVEADLCTAAVVAEAVGLNTSSRCGQCGDLAISGLEFPAEDMYKELGGDVIFDIIGTKEVGAILDSAGYSDDWSYAVR